MDRAPITFVPARARFDKCLYYGVKPNINLVALRLRSCINVRLAVLKPALHIDIALIKLFRCKLESQQ